MSEQDCVEKKETSACGPGCNCGASSSGRSARVIAGVLVLLIAGALVVRAVVKEREASEAPAPTAGFATLPAATAQGDAARAAPPATDALKEIAALAELNTLAADTAGVFVFLPPQDGTAGEPLAVMQGAARTIESGLPGGGSIGLFKLNAASADYGQLSSQVPAPRVLALVKGGGMNAVSEEITEAKLVQAFVAASSAGGCGPSGCGPGSSGCN